MSSLDNLRARLPWSTPAPSVSDSAPIEALSPSQAARIRLSWLSRFTSGRLEAQVAANPQLSLWMPETSEYVVGDGWRNRDDIAHIVEVSPRRGRERLVGALADKTRSLGYRLLIASDEIRDGDAQMYERLGFSHIERIVFFRKQLRDGSDLLSQTLTPALEIKRAGAADIETLLHVDHASFPWLWWNSRQEFEVYMDIPGVYTNLAYWEGQPVGYTAFTLYDDWAHLDRIAVTEGAQGKGLGAAQLVYALQIMAGSRAGHVALSTQQNNTQSHKLYLRHGFTRTNDRMDFYGLRLEP